MLVLWSPVATFLIHCHLRLPNNIKFAAFSQDICIVKLRDDIANTLLLAPTEQHHVCCISLKISNSSPHYQNISTPRSYHPVHWIRWICSISSIHNKILEHRSTILIKTSLPAGKGSLHQLLPQMWRIVNVLVRIQFKCSTMKYIAALLMSEHFSPSAVSNLLIALFTVSLRGLK